MHSPIGLIYGALFDTTDELVKMDVCLIDFIFKLGDWKGIVYWKTAFRNLYIIIWHFT